MALHKSRGPGSDSVSGAKLGLYGTIGTAIIGAATTIIVGWLHPNGSGASTGPPPTTTSAAITPAAAMTITPTAKQTSDSGSAYRFVIDGTGDVTVSGSAQPDVIGMYVVIGPKPSGGFWGAFANVVNQQWQANVRTDSPWQNYPIEVRPYYGPSGGATRPNAFKFTFQGTEPTTPPPRPPDDVLKCVEQSGPSCFKGPEFGPPSVYQSNQ
jgi:hypothetical protein